MTYLRAYLLVPLLCLWPVGLHRLTLALVRSAHDDAYARLPQVWEFAFAALMLVNVFAVLLVAARRMRGAPGSRRRPAS